MCYNGKQGEMKMKNRIRELRKELGLTQEELGKMIGLSERSVGSYETSDRDPDTDTLNKLAQIFDCTIDYMLMRSNTRKIEEKKEMADAEEMYRVDPEFLIEMCRAKVLPDEVRKRLREYAAFEMERFLKEKDSKND